MRSLNQKACLDVQRNKMSLGQQEVLQEVDQRWSKMDNESVDAIVGSEVINGLSCHRHSPAETERDFWVTAADDCFS